MFIYYIKDKEWLSLPFTSEDIQISNRGLVRINGNLIKTFKDSEGNLKVKINWINGFYSYNLALLVAIVFKPINIPFNYLSCLNILFKDGNPSNVRPYNLIWKFPIGLGYNDYNGFAFIPNFTKYVINKEGDVYQIETNQKLNCHYSKGYYSYSLKHDNGRRYKVKRHRLVAFTYLDYPANIDELEVNHLNGVKGDDRVDNLEICTSSSNRIHAIKHGLTNVNKPVSVKDHNGYLIDSFNSLKEFCEKYNLNRRQVSSSLVQNNNHFKFGEYSVSFKNAEHCRKGKNISTKILVRNLVTRKVTEYDSILECSMLLGISKNTIDVRINSPTSNLYDDYLQIKRKSDDTPWYEPLNLYQEILESSWEKITLVKDLSCDVVYEFENQKSASEFLNISQSTINNWLKFNGRRIFKNATNGNYILVKNKKDAIPWMKVDNPEESYFKQNNVKRIVVKNSINGDIKIFDKAIDCARYYNLLPTTLNYRLNNNDSKVYRDGLSYSYL